MLGGDSGPEELTVNLHVFIHSDVNTKVMAENKFGYAEVVDTFVDLINAATAFAASVAGGFNLVKFLSFALDKYPDLQEAVQDFGTFTAEFLDLTAQEGLNAVGEIEQRVNPSPIATKVVGFLKICAVSYSFIDRTVSGAKGIVDMTKQLFAKRA